MNFTQSPFEGFTPPSLSSITKAIFCFGMECMMFLLFYSVYTETISFMGETYLSELPLLGSVFMHSDATASNIISIILALFTLLTPIYIWTEIFKHNIFENFRDWISHPSHRITASIALFILALSIGLEILNIYTMIAKEAMPQGGFIQVQAQSGMMSYLAKNKGLAIGVSIMIAIINMTLALFTVRTFSSLSAPQE